MSKTLISLRRLVGVISREQETDGDPSSLTQSLLWVGFVFCAKGRDVRPMKREGPIDPSPSVVLETLPVYGSASTLTNSLKLPVC